MKSSPQQIWSRFLEGFISRPVTQRLCRQLSTTISPQPAEKHELPSLAFSGERRREPCRSLEGKKKAVRLSLSSLLHSFFLWVLKNISVLHLCAFLSVAALLSQTLTSVCERRRPSKVWTHLYVAVKAQLMITQLCVHAEGILGIDTHAHQRAHLCCEEQLLNNDGFLVKNFEIQ